ncbi:DUF6998 domain-containing protein [Microbacterium jiangjiandongii]|uniref:DUF6998 domain-containing protein n=1 Tax=Microbacterium jiangjiandongii TaxID=3049071 RepID=UPI0035A95F5E
MNPLADSTGHRNGWCEGRLPFMSTVDLSDFTTAELFELHARIGQEFARRGVSRTSGSIQGEVGEALALAVYGGTLPAPGTKGYDLLDAQSRRVQVKTRTLPRGVERIFQFRTLDIDLAVCVRFDRATNDLDWAREYEAQELRSLVSAHASGPRLATARARENGRDVTAAFRSAYEALRSESPRSSTGA